MDLGSGVGSLAATGMPVSLSVSSTNSAAWAPRWPYGGGPAPERTASTRLCAPESSSRPAPAAASDRPPTDKAASLRSSDALRHELLLTGAELNAVAHGATARRDVGSLLPVSSDTSYRPGVSRWPDRPGS